MWYRGFLDRHRFHSTKFPYCAGSGMLHVVCWPTTPVNIASCVLHAVVCCFSIVCCVSETKRKNHYFDPSNFLLIEFIYALSFGVSSSTNFCNPSISLSLRRFRLYALLSRCLTSNNDPLDIFANRRLSASLPRP